MDICDITQEGGIFKILDLFASRLESPYDLKPITSVTLLWHLTAAPIPVRMVEGEHKVL